MYLVRRNLRRRWHSAFVIISPGLPFAGVILNRVASPRHEALARRGMELHNIPVLGCLPKRGDLVLPERHLGLIQAVEHPDLETAIDGYADFVEPHIDLDALMQAAASSTSYADTTDSATDFSQIAPPAQKIALAQDEASLSLSLFHLPIRIFWKAGVSKALKLCPSRRLMMNARKKMLILSGWLAAIPNCMAAGWHRRQTVLMQSAIMQKPKQCMASVAAIWC